MTRRCSHCSNNGHNSRTCPSRGGLKLFGVRLTDGSIKKSASMGNLSSVNYHSSSSSPNQGSPSSNHLRDPAPVAEGYASDDLAHASCSSTCRGDRKKGTPWTEDEHRLFLVGLQKLGKGDWRGIARNYVVSRTPTQVASHAQKYFIRQSNSTRRKRRSSLFDMIPDVSAEPLPVKEEQFLLRSPVHKAENMNSLPHLHLSLDCEPEPMESISNNSTLNEPQGRVSNTNIGASPLVPAAFYPAYIHVPLPIRPPNLTNPGEERMMSHQVLKPTPIHSKDPVNVDELVGMSNKLTLGDAASGRMEPSELSMKLLGVSSRPSAFHANPTLGGPEMSRNNDNVIHAV